MTPNLEPLLTRRSVSVRDLVAPGPNATELEQILRVATRVPDHGKLTPWRICILRGEGAVRLGSIAAARLMATHPEATEAQITAEKNRFQRAPLVLAVLSTPVPDTKPLWEQQLSAGAVCMNILHAAHALGYGGKWLTEWVAYDAEIIAALMNASLNSPLAGESTRPLSASVGGNKANVAIAGFLYLGSKTTTPDDRERPALADIVVEF